MKFGYALVSTIVQEFKSCRSRKNLLEQQQKDQNFKNYLSNSKKMICLFVKKLERFLSNTREARETIQHLFHNDIKIHNIMMCTPKVRLFS